MTNPFRRLKPLQQLPSLPSQANSSIAAGGRLCSCCREFIRRDRRSLPSQAESSIAAGGRLCSCCREFIRRDRRSLPSQAESSISAGGRLCSCCREFIRPDRRSLPSQANSSIAAGGRETVADGCKAPTPLPPSLKGGGASPFPLGEGFRERWFQPVPTIPYTQSRTGGRRRPARRRNRRRPGGYGWSRTAAGNPGRRWCARRPWGRPG
jgi:hypothetical protein